MAEEKQEKVEKISKPIMIFIGTGASLRVDDQIIGLLQREIRLPIDILPMRPLVIENLHQGFYKTEIMFEHLHIMKNWLHHRRARGRRVQKIIQMNQEKA